MGAKKMGRPKSTDPRTESVGVRMTPEEKDKLDFLCKERKCSRRDFFIQCIEEAYNKKE